MTSSFDPTAQTEVHSAGPQDAGDLSELIRELAVSEGKTETEHLSSKKVASWLKQSPPPFEALLAGQPGARLGYIAFYKVFSLFLGGPVLLVENLYVRPAARGLGLGRLLLRQASSHAVEQGINRVELNVRNDNRETMAFYQRCGFHHPDEDVFRIEGDSLRKFTRQETRS